MAGGSDSRGWDRMNKTEIYDPRTGKFTAASPMNDKRFKLPDEAVRLPSGRLLVAGGSKEAEVFDPEDGKFVAVAGPDGRAMALHERNQAARWQRLVGRGLSQ